MAHHDRQYWEAAQIERLAERDPVFARNYTACVSNQKFRQLRPTVTQWLVRQALARERREQGRVQAQAPRPYVPQTNTVQLEQELYGRAA